MPTDICRHIKTNGERCGSPALTHKVFCYFHHDLRKRHAAPQRDPTPAIIHSTLDDGRGQREALVAESIRPVFPDLELPPLEDRESIQIAISVVVNALAANRIDPRRASTLLYALQVASANCNRLDLAPSHRLIVRDTVLAPSGAEHIAPDEDPQAEIDFQRFLADLQEEHDEDCDCGDCEEDDD